MACSRTAVSITAIARRRGSAAELPADDFAGAAVDDRVQIDPAVSATQIDVMSNAKLPGPLDHEEPGPPALGLVRAPLDQLGARASPAARALRLIARPSLR